MFLSCKVKKYNKYDWKQERTFVVTELNLYNLKGKSKIKQYRLRDRAKEKDCDSVVSRFDSEQESEESRTCNPYSWRT